MKKKIMTMLMLLAVSCMIMPTNAKAAKKAYIKTATGSKATVFVGKTLKLNAKTVGKKKKITYKTSKKSVATVNKKGVIKGKKYGTAKITMKASGVKTKKITKRPIVVLIARGTASLGLSVSPAAIPINSVPEKA